jgi:hypothetical protein
MMMDFPGVYYAIDGIREAIGAHPSSEEVLVVKPLVKQLDALKTSHGHAHSPPKIDLQVIQGERTTTSVNRK